MLLMRNVWENRLPWLVSNNVDVIMLLTESYNTLISKNIHRMMLGNDKRKSNLWKNKNLKMAKYYSIHFILSKKNKNSNNDKNAFLLKLFPNTFMA